MKISKLTQRKLAVTSKVAQACSSSGNAQVKHTFRTVSAEEVNKNRPTGYQYLSF